MNLQCLAFFGAPGPMEMMIVGMIALLLFGKRLPEVARSLGKGLVEFKRGMTGIQEEVQRTQYDIDEAANQASTSRPIPAEEQEELQAPKFEPPKAAPASTEEKA